jgi:cytochrome d ubiquinol oxidase subunit I
MQNPVGSRFNPETMRMEVTDFMAVLFNPVAQASSSIRSAPAMSAPRSSCSASRPGISSKANGSRSRGASFTVAAAFGLASSLSVVVLGDESGYALTDNQKMKLAALEAMWHTEPAPAGIADFRYSRAWLRRETL